MVQVKIFSESSYIALQNAINDFLKNGNLSSHAFQYSTSGGGPYGPNVVYSCMVIYTLRVLEERIHVRD